MNTIPDMRRLDCDTLLVASHNAGKIDEMRALIEPFGFAVTSAAELGLAVPEETGTTFEENAAIKALASARAAGMPALADDSGLMVDALGGAPGVHTADWAETPGGGRDFMMAMRKVEEALAARGASAPDDRRARFVCVLCLAWPDGETSCFRGEVEGRLVWPPRGEQGFGYDPVFLPDGLARTFGEMPAADKHGLVPGRPPLSHRARAFARFAAAALP